MHSATSGLQTLKADEQTSRPQRDKLDELDEQTSEHFVSSVERVYKDTLQHQPALLDEADGHRGSC